MKSRLVVTMFVFFLSFMYEHCDYEHQQHDQVERQVHLTTVPANFFFRVLHGNEMLLVNKHFYTISKLPMQWGGGGKVVKTV